MTAQTDPHPSVLVKGRRVRLGRAEQCEVRIPDPSVSREHAVLIKRGTHYLLMDQGSHHGTAVALPGHPPVQLAPDSPRILKDGEHIWLGHIELEVRLEAAPRGTPAQTEDLAPALVRAGLTAIGVEATASKIQEVLNELTELEDEPMLDLEPEELTPARERVGVAALAEDDQHPPWVTDAFLGVLATLLAAGCIYGLSELASTF